MIINKRKVLTERVKTSQILPGDVILFHGENATVSAKDIKKDVFMGVSIFGDCFGLTGRMVTRAKLSGSGCIQYLD